MRLLGLRAAMMAAVLASFAVSTAETSSGRREEFKRQLSADAAYGECAGSESL
jgi:hypothetical protein